jgi:hypothetical protein
MALRKKQPNEPNLVKAQAPETLYAAVAVSEPMPLFTDAETEGFRSQWSNLQTAFVDEPRHTVENADKLAAAVMPTGGGFAPFRETVKI